MSGNTFIVVLLVIGPLLAMVFVHRGGAGTGGDSYVDHDGVDRVEHRPVIGVNGENAPGASGDATGKHRRHGCH